MNTESYKDHYPVIAPLIMGLGIGDGKTTACVMAQAATIDALRKGKTLETPTDEMECACPVLRCIAINLNDTAWWSDDVERTNALRPIIPMLLDSRGDRELTWRRIFFSCDHAVRVITPMRMEWVSKNNPNKSQQILEWARKIQNLNPIIGRESALAARDICWEIKSAAAAAAAYAAYAAYAVDAAAVDAAAADADAAAADAYAAAAAVVDQKRRYRDSLLKCFIECAALK